MPTVSSTFIYIGNLAQIDTVETNYYNENPGVLYQTFTNDVMVVTQVEQTDANGDAQVQSDDNGQIADTFTYDLGSGTVVSGLDCAGRYYANYVDENGFTQSTIISAYQTQNGDVFLKFPNGINVQSVTITGIAGDGYISITYGTSSTAQVVCYAHGTLIGTPDGGRAVEMLNVGDRVNTLDRGVQSIRWVHSADCQFDSTDQDVRPVMISAGALGPGRPSHDLIVSPQHRVCVGGGGQLQNWFKTMALAPAKSLTKLPGIRQMEGRGKITWFHFAFDRHEIVFANGCLAESLLLGPLVLNGLSRSEQKEVAKIYGSLPTKQTILNGPAAKKCLKVGEVQRHLNARGKAIGLVWENDVESDVESDMEKWDMDLAMDRSDVQMSDTA